MSEPTNVTLDESEIRGVGMAETGGVSCGRAAIKVR